MSPLVNAATAARALGSSLLPIALLLWPITALSQDHQHTRPVEEREQASPAGDQEVLLWDNLGSHHYPIATEVAEAQAYFDQGLRLYYAFNHHEAIRSFRKAQSLDSRCAMCWWGEALAWGPNINLPMDSAAAVAARGAVDQAVALKPHAEARERELIEALDARYAVNPPGQRTHLDSTYAAAMLELALRYPDDDEILVLHAEALMDLRPWDYWTEDGELQPGMQEALDGLEEVLDRNEDHPGACHFFIHAVEKVHPEWAVPCAERLASLMPGAGHIVHMPGHIYVRVGRYRDAIRANQHAVHADESYIQDLRPTMGMYTAGYYPHNYDFMAFAAAMVGRSDLAIEAADKVADLIPSEMLGDPGLTFLQHYLTRPLQLRIRFSDWPGILATPAPDESLPHARGMWHYARGRALAATGDLPGAETELSELRTKIGALEGVRLEFNSAPAILGIGAGVLEGRIALARGNVEGAVRALRGATRAEDALLYGEPPEWTIPVRHELGEVLLTAGRGTEAEAVFREDLERFPGNGWSLYGLARSLEAQGRNEEAAAVQDRFETAWDGADVPVLFVSLEWAHRGPD